jgi:hypothetical protein
MFSNRFAFIVLGLACITAAAGGGYLAIRQNTVPVPAAAAGAPPAGSPSPTAATDRGVPDRPVDKTEPAQAPEPIVNSRTAKAPSKPSTTRRDDRPTAARPGFSATSSQAAATPQTPATPQLPPTTTPSLPAPPPAVDTPPAPAPRPETRVAQEPAPSRAPEPVPQATFEELVVAANSVIGLQTETRVSSETARVEDRVEARVTRDVRVGDKVAVPAGARAIGSVTLVERGGKFKERARLGIRFHTLVLADGTRLPMSTETIYRDGEAPGDASATKIGAGAVGGAILGAILGGAKGAAIGATAGAGGGAAVVAAGDRSAATLPQGTPMTVRLLSPLSITIER